MFATIWNTVLFYPILNLMLIFYHFLGNNLGLAIIFIAIIIRLAMIPLVRQQTETTRKMASLKPELEILQKKYANNKEKLAEEQMKLYKKVGYNPIGCLGSFIPQIIILSVLYSVIRALTIDSFTGIYPWVQDLIGYTEGFQLNKMFIYLDLTKSYSSVSSEFGRFAIQSLPYIFLAILVGVVQYLATVFTQKIQNPLAKSKKKSNKTEELSPEDMQEQMQSSMLFMFPVMTAILAISTPAALGVYWLIQSVMLVVQYFVLDFDKSKKGVQNLWSEIFNRNK